jgi:hypothetical protein
MNKRWIILCSIGALAAAPAVAAAQAQIVPKEKDDTLKGAGEEDIQGWNPSLSGTATVNLVSNSNVVGQVDGFSALFGLGILGGADYVHDAHLFRGTLSINESFARTSVVDDLVKTNDVVQLEGLYNYFLTKRVGLFGRLSVKTSAFAAADVRGTETTWVEKTDPPTPLTTMGFRQRLADPFAPFTVSESAGLFGEPLGEPWLSLAVRVGVGGRQTLAEGVLLIDDAKETPEVELLRLADVYQLGIEGFAGAVGKLKRGKLDYRAGLAVLLPVVNNDKFDRNAGALTRVGLESTVTFNVLSWMSLVYTLNVTRDPQLFPKGDELTQVQNSLLLTFKYTLVERSKKKKKPTAAEQELADAKARAEAAEKARAEAEAKVRELEQKLGACTGACPPAAAETPPAPAPDAAPIPTPVPTP